MEFKELGIDPSGENGEYHTVVLDGPIFKNEVNVAKKEVVNNNNYWFQTIELINS
jgi:diphthamide synthase (EF-2-diphthine--ammonia ligase)